MSIFLALNSVDNEIFQDEAENVNAFQSLQCARESLSNHEAQVVPKLSWLLPLGEVWLPFEAPTSVRSCLVVQALLDHTPSGTLTITDVQVFSCVLSLCSFLKS